MKKLTEKLTEELLRTKPTSCPYGHVYRLENGELFVWGSPDDPIESAHEYVGTFEE